MVGGFGLPFSFSGAGGGAAPVAGRMFLSVACFRRSLLPLFLRLCQDFLTRGGGTRAKMWRAAEVDISFHRSVLPLLRHLVISPCQGETGEGGKWGRRIGMGSGSDGASIAPFLSLLHRSCPRSSRQKRQDGTATDRNGPMPASVAFLAVLHRHLMLSRRGQRYETKTRGAAKEGGRDMPRLLSGRRWRGATRRIPVVLGLHLVFPRFSCRCLQTTGPILTNWSE